MEQKPFGIGFVIRAEDQKYNNNYKYVNKGVNSSRKSIDIVPSLFQRCWYSSTKRYNNIRGKQPVNNKIGRAHV